MGRVLDRITEEMHVERAKNGDERSCAILLADAEIGIAKLAADAGADGSMVRDIAYRKFMGVVRSFRPGAAPLWSYWKLAIKRGLIDLKRREKPHASLDEAIDFGFEPSVEPEQANSPLVHVVIHPGRAAGVQREILSGTATRELEKLFAEFVGVRVAQKAITPVAAREAIGTMRSGNLSLFAERDIILAEMLLSDLFESALRLSSLLAAGATVRQAVAEMGERLRVAEICLAFLRETALVVVLDDYGTTSAETGACSEVFGKETRTGTCR